MATWRLSVWCVAIFHVLELLIEGFYRQLPNSFVVRTLHDP